MTFDTILFLAKDLEATYLELFLWVLIMLGMVVGYKKIKLKKWQEWTLSIIGLTVLARVVYLAILS